MNLLSLSKSLYSRFRRKTKKESLHAEESAPVVSASEPPAVQTAKEPPVVEPANSEPTPSDLGPLTGFEIDEIARLTGSVERWVLEGFRRDAEFRKQLADLRVLQDEANRRPRTGPRKFTSFEMSQLEKMFGTLEPTTLDWIASTWSEEAIRAIVNPPRIDSRVPATREMKRIVELGGGGGVRAKKVLTPEEKLAELNDSDKMQFLMDHGDSQGRVYDPARGEMVVDLRKLRR